MDLWEPTGALYVTMLRCTIVGAHSAAAAHLFEFKIRTLHLAGLFLINYASSCDIYDLKKSRSETTGRSQSTESLIPCMEKLALLSQWVWNALMDRARDGIRNRPKGNMGSTCRREDFKWAKEYIENRFTCYQPLQVLTGFNSLALKVLTTGYVALLTDSVPTWFNKGA